MGSTIHGGHDRVDGGLRNGGGREICALEESIQEQCDRDAVRGVCGWETVLEMVITNSYRDIQSSGQHPECHEMQLT